MKISHSIAVSNSIVGFNSQNKSLDGSPASFPFNRLRTAHLPPKSVYKIHISFRARPRTLAGGSRIAAFLLMAVNSSRAKSLSIFHAAIPQLRVLENPLYNQTNRSIAARSTLIPIENQAPSKFVLPVRCSLLRKTPAFLDAHRSV